MFFELTEAILSAIDPGYREDTLALWVQYEECAPVGLWLPTVHIVPINTCPVKRTFTDMNVAQLITAHCFAVEASQAIKEGIKIWDKQLKIILGEIAPVFQGVLILVFSRHCAEENIDFVTQIMAAATVADEEASGNVQACHEIAKEVLSRLSRSRNRAAVAASLN